MAAKVRIHEEANCRLMTSREFLIEKDGPNAPLYRYSEEALNTKMRIFEEGSATSPQLFESQVPPNAVAAVHSHPEDEIIYILGGEMILGKRSLKKGSSLFIAANTLYGFTAGPEGVQFLNFRPHRC